MTSRLDLIYARELRCLNRHPGIPLDGRCCTKRADATGAKGSTSFNYYYPASRLDKSAFLTECAIARNLGSGEVSEGREALSTAGQETGATKDLTTVRNAGLDLWQDSRCWLYAQFDRQLHSILASDDRMVAKRDSLTLGTG